MNTKNIAGAIIAVGCGIVTLIAVIGAIIAFVAISWLLKGSAA